MLSEHYTAAVVIATRFNVLALIIRWSTKEVTKRPFKIVCIFSCKLWRNELLLLNSFVFKTKFPRFYFGILKRRHFGHGYFGLELNSRLAEEERGFGAPTHIILFSSIWYVLFLQAQASELHKRTFLRSVYLYQTYFGGKTIQNRHQTSQAKASWREQFFFSSLHINFYYFINSR